MWLRKSWCHSAPHDVWEANNDTKKLQFEWGENKKWDLSTSCSFTHIMVYHTNMTLTFEDLVLWDRLLGERKMWYSRNLIITFYPLSKAMARWTNKPARECPNVLTYVEVTLSHWMTLRCTSFSNLSAGKPEIATILHLYQTSRSYTSAFSVMITLLSVALIPRLTLPSTNANKGWGRGVKTPFLSLRLRPSAATRQWETD